MGGFVSVPGGLAAWLLRKPLIIHEQNAVAGSANRLLRHFAKRVLTGFSSVFVDGERVGNPVRKEIALLPLKGLLFDMNSKRPLNMLVIGGSLGAKAINDVLPSLLKRFPSSNLPDVWHQTGKTTYEATLALYEKEKLVIDGKHLRVTEFINDMAAAYAWADLVLCRAGAITLAEIACAGLPSILVPLPGAIDNHQYKNAEQFADEGAAILLPQNKLSADGLFAIVMSLVSDHKKLHHMSHEAKQLAEPHAAQRVAEICLQAGGHHG
jgi:UDP-N-acetylglucosamine--N-acetylmuramyl-(pentapeptide) pyrophosphoryl-undecaprenol N-acetylglucosamine transferase